MNIELGDAGTEAFEHPSPVRLHGFILQATSMNEVVGVDDAIGVELTSLVPAAEGGQGRLRAHPNGQVELFGQRTVDLEIRFGILQRAHVRVQVRDVDAGVQRFPDLRARLDGRLLGCACLYALDVWPEIALRVHQPRHEASFGHRAPLDPGPLGCVHEVQPEVGFRMVACVAGDLGNTAPAP